MIRVTEEPISAQPVVDSLKIDISGSVVVHLAILRPSSEGQKLVAMEYNMDKDSAEKELFGIESQIRAKWQIQDVSLFRHKGRVGMGEVILIAAVASPHRKEAFEACEFAVEKLRNMTSVKRREIYG